MKKTQLKTANEYYEQYEHLAKKYSREVWDTWKIGMEQEDILQELKLKLYVGIIAYINKFREYEKTGRLKPVPIEYYLRTVLMSKIKDFIKEINEQQYAVSLSNEEVNMEIGYHGDFNIVDWKKREIIVNDIDILHGLNWEEKGCFCLFLKGFNLASLSSLYSDKLDPRSIIKNQLAFLKTYEPDLLKDKSGFVIQFEFSEAN